MGDTGEPTPEPLRANPVVTPLADRSHALHLFTGRVLARLDELGSVLTATMTVTERAETAAEAIRLQDRLAAMVTGLVAEDPAVVAAVRGRTRITAQTGRRLTRRAREAGEHPDVHAAVASGEIHLDQAEVITHVIGKLPAEVSHLKKEAEAHLLELAADHDAVELKAMANHLLYVIAPDQADELLAKQLEREEREARRTAFLKVYRDGHGSTWIKGKIPDLAGQILETLLAAVANPQRPEPIDRTNADPPEVKGRAFVELLEKIKVKDLPKTGGTPVSVIVTMPLETLTGGIQPGTILGTDVQISAGEARRLAATHGVIPAVLGGKSEVLDVGRKKRLFTRAQRVAMALRQGGLCNRQGCDVPAAWCDANHRTDWAKGGTTSIDDAELVCPHDHTLHHQGVDFPRRT